MWGNELPRGGVRRPIGLTDEPPFVAARGFNANQSGPVQGRALQFRVAGIRVRQAKLAAVTQAMNVKPIARDVCLSSPIFVTPLDAEAADPPSCFQLRFHGFCISAMILRSRRRQEGRLKPAKTGPRAPASPDRSPTSRKAPCSEYRIPIPVKRPPPM